MYTQSPLTDAHWVDSSCPLLILPCFNFVPSRRGLKQASVLCSITWAVWILCYTAIIEEACFLPLPLPIPIHFSNPYLTPSFSSSLPSKFLWWSLLYCHRIWFLPLNYCCLCPYPVILLHTRRVRAHIWLLPLSSEPYRAETIHKYHVISSQLGTSLCHGLVDNKQFTFPSTGMNKEGKDKETSTGIKGISKGQKKEKSQLFISGFPSCLLSASLRYDIPFTASPTITKEAFS